MRNNYFLFPLIFLKGILCYGQSETVYDGEYEFKGKTGRATFEFREDVDGNVIMHGFFNFERKEIDSLDQTLLTKFEARGNYEDNQKAGNWSFDQERHKVNLEDVIDFEVIASLESEDIEIKASYKEGLPNGVWQYLENIFEGGKVQERAKAEDINFDGGLMKGGIYYRSFYDNFTQFIRGEINDNGYMHGEWSLVYVKDSILISEVRNYENGLLLGVVRRDLDSGEKMDEAIFFSTIEKLNLVNNEENEGFVLADGGYGINYNDGYMQNTMQQQIQKPGNDFIENFITKIMRFDDAVENEETIVRYPFFTKRFEFEFTKEEEELLVEIPVIYDQIRDSVERYSEMNSLALNQTKSDSLAFAYAYFNNRLGKLDRIEPTIELIRSGEIRYYDMKNYTKDGVSFMSAIDMITYNYEEDTLRKMLPREVSFQSSTSFFDNLRDYLTEEMDFVADISSFVTTELYDIEVNTKLVALEAEIVDRKEELDSLYANYSHISNAEENLLEAIQNNFIDGVFEKLSSEYANEIEFEAKMDKGRVILDLFDELEKRFSELTLLYPRREELDEIYMEETFNPFTYSRYDTRAKERLYDAGEILFEHYMEELKEEEDYTQIKEHINRIANLQDRLVELRDQDTRALERRLGRRNTPGRIESALDL
ncbi:hypothetical protein [Pleomorphovibrio marinus]|uniref:hypothetical protein n=1 Tax=Pleomorphovibrio marinus TaxID=2164132 RepID=UPI000E0B1324|nr:hypothetical protein [Pleomorphovibrio marinus]